MLQAPHKGDNKDSCLLNIKRPCLKWFESISNGQYLKSDNIYASAKTFACSNVSKLRIRKKAFNFIICFAANIFNMTSEI